MKRYLLQSVMIAMAALLTACASADRGAAADAADTDKQPGAKKCVPTTGSNICRDA